MTILGVSSDFHDSSAALVVDGHIVASAAEERFSYQKHDPSFPSLAIDGCLQQAGLSYSDIDLVAYHEDPVVKFSRVLASKTSGYPRGFLSFANAMREMMQGQLWVKFDIAKKTGIRPSNIHCVPHHLSHAAYAFMTSGLKSAAILILDAVGEWSSTTMFQARLDSDGRPQIETLGVVPYPHSLGMVYSAFTGFLGFKVNDSECSTMALASFGQPRYLDKVQKVLRSDGQGSYEVSSEYFDFSSPDRLPLTKKFYALFGEPRSHRDKLPFSSTAALGSGAAIDEKSQYYADVACSVQTMLEQIVLEICAKLKRMTGEENLCLGGGVALNCSMNGRVIREGGFREVFIPPDPGDGGGALGAALYASSLVEAKLPKQEFSPYGGRSYDEQEAIAAALHLNSHEIDEYRATPSVHGSVQGFQVEKFEGRFDQLAERVADYLKSGKIVGWFQGRFENGARALGNRSLLIDPANGESARRLSRHVKLRASFRPYACSLNSENYSRIFETGNGKIPAGVRWMSSAQPVRSEAQPWITQAMHTDLTTRPQVLMKNENPRYHRLLQSWESISGNPALLNTSFNESGYPLVSSPIDALLMFMRTDIEAVALNDTLITKRF